MAKKPAKIDIQKALRHPRFRLEEAKIYWIVSKEKDERGKDISRWVPFYPLPIQKTIFRKLYSEGKRRILIPKARREGCSTAINLAQLDSCLNTTDFHSRIVDQNENDATDKLVNRVTKAWEQLERSNDTGLSTDPVRGGAKSASEVKWSNGSRFTASISGRGGEAAHFLHISELGPIDFKDAKRANEIMDGALPAADAGIQVIESTAKGPIGHFKRLCDNAMMVPVEERTQDDWEVLFFAWFDDPRHSLIGRFSRVSKKINDYLDYIQEKTGVILTEQQRIWYQVTSERVANVKYEYPSLLVECWEQPIEGAIYATEINEARSDGRVGKFPYEASLPVWTIWDIGAPENTRCIFFQTFQGEIRIIDAEMGGYDETTRHDGPRYPSDWAQVLKERPYFYGGHLLPHDASHRKYSDDSFKGDLIKAGVREVGQYRKRGAGDDFEHIRPTWGAFNRFVFNTDSPGVDTLLKHLSMYHTKTENDGITIKEKPHHNFASHYAEPFSAIIIQINTGKCGGNPYIGKAKRKNRRKLKIKPYSAYSR